MNYTPKNTIQLALVGAITRILWLNLTILISFGIVFLLFRLISYLDIWNKWFLWLRSSLYIVGSNIRASTIRCSASIKKEIIFHSVHEGFRFSRNRNSDVSYGENRKSFLLIPYPIIVIKTFWIRIKWWTGCRFIIVVPIPWRFRKIIIFMTGTIPITVLCLSCV